MALQDHSREGGETLLDVVPGGGGGSPVRKLRRGQWRTPYGAAASSVRGGSIWAWAPNSPNHKVGAPSP
jgi:hypothetical protein